MVITPQLRKIDEIMQKCSNLGSWPSELICELSDLITAVGSICKGFPDYEEKQYKPCSPPAWTFIFEQSLKGIIVVLGKLSEHPEIREAV